MRLPANADEANSPSSELGIQRDVDFSDYVWMGEEMEEFDSKCIMELCEEEFIESCFEELFEEERQFAEEMELYLSSLTQEEVGCLVSQLDAVSIHEARETSPRDDDASPDESADHPSRLNPDAAVFVPSSDKEEPPEEK